MPAVAVFWIDAEDHDWDEVRRCAVLDAELHGARRSRLPRPAAPATSRWPRLALDAPIDAALDELAGAAAAHRVHARRCWTTLRSAYRPGVGMAEAFGRWLEHVLGPLGLVVFDSSDPAAKPLVRERVRARARAPAAPRSSRRRPATRCVAAATTRRSTPHDEQPRAVPPGWRPARHPPAGRQFVVGDDAQLPLAELARARRMPGALQPERAAAAARAGHAVPDRLYVAGPNELAYLGQLRGVYEHFGVPMPLMYPRAIGDAARLGRAAVPRRVRAAARGAAAPGRSALNQLLEAQLPPDVEASLDDAVRGDRRRSWSALIAAVPAIDPTLEGAARSTLGSMQHDLQTLHGKIIHAAKRRDETLRRQFMRTRRRWRFPAATRRNATSASCRS